MLYFNDFTDKFLNNHFKDFKKVDNSGFRIENINSELDNYIDIAEK